MPAFLCPFCGNQTSHYSTHRGSGEKRQVKVRCPRCKKESFQKYSDHV